MIGQILGLIASKAGKGDNNTQPVDINYQNYLNNIDQMRSKRKPVENNVSQQPLSRSGSSGIDLNPFIDSVFKNKSQNNNMLGGY